MDQQRVECSEHGLQEFAIACIHVCRAIEGGQNVGFFWSPDTHGPRPDAWCADCEKWVSQNPDASNAEFISVADFQFLCVRGWDEAKERLFELANQGG